MHRGESLLSSLYELFDRLIKPYTTGILTFRNICRLAKEIIPNREIFLFFLLRVHFFLWISEMLKHGLFKDVIERYAVTIFTVGNIVRIEEENFSLSFFLPFLLPAFIFSGSREENTRRGSARFHPSMGSIKSQVAREFRLAK